MNRLDVIVIGTTHHNTLGVIRSLGENSLHLNSILILYGENESYLTLSKYVSRCVFIEKADEITHALLGIVKDEKQVIIAVTDEAVHQLDVNADILSTHFYFFKTVVPGELTRLMDKAEQDAVAKCVGLYAPVNYTVDNIVYPCLLKPQASIAGGKKVIICNNKDDFDNAIIRFPGTQFQIQQYLKKEKEIVLVGMSVGNEVTIPAVVLKHRELQGGTTYSTVLPITEIDNELLEQSKELIKTIGYEGLFGIEFIYCEGKYYFIEVNLRNDATSYAVTVAGANLPLAYTMAVSGMDIEWLNETTVCSIDAMVEFRDFDFVLTKRLSLLKWIKQRNSCKCLYYYSESDKKPYLFCKSKLKNGLLLTVRNKIQIVFKLK